MAAFLSALGCSVRGHGLELQELSCDHEAKGKRAAEKLNPSLDIIIAESESYTCVTPRFLCENTIVLQYLLLRASSMLRGTKDI